MSRRAPRQIGDALSTIRSQLEPPSMLASVQAVWAEVMGPELSAVTQPVAERQGRVTVHCADTIWAEELSMMHDDLLDRLTQRLGGMSPKELKFRFGELSL